MEKTDSGMPFDYHLTGPDGAHFELYPEPYHTEKDIKKAKTELRRDRDVVSIKIIRH